MSTVTYVHVYTHTMYMHGVIGDVEREKERKKERKKERHLSMYMYVRL